MMLRLGRRRHAYRRGQTPVTRGLAPTVLAALAAVALSAGLTGCFNAPAQIISIDPNRGSVSVPADAPIRVIFDHPADHDSVASHFSVDIPLAQCDLRAAFHARLDAPCYVKWLADQPGFIFFHPRSIFAANTTYNFTLGSGIVDVNGTVNSLDHHWDITTAPAPTLAGADPGNSGSVSRDAPIALTFSRPMAEASTAAAITLDPAVPGLKVVRNGRDHGRFEVLPGHLLAPNTAYTLAAATTATDEHGQPLDKGYSVHFRTGGMSAGGHALVIANQAGEGATSLYLTLLQARASDEPIPNVILRQPPRCAEPSGCGLVAWQQPLVTYRDAALAVGARWLAIVESDQTMAAAPTQIRIVDLSNDTDEDLLRDASMPAWSPDGSTLAYAATDGSVHIYRPDIGSLSSLPTGAPLAGTPVWSADGLTLALPVSGSAAAPVHVELAAPALRARYALPGLTGRSDDPVAAPNGSILAVRVVSASGTSASWIVDLASGQKPRLLAGDLTPIGFTDSGALIAVADGGAANPSLVRDSVDSGDVSSLAIPAGRHDLNTATVSISGRQVAYIATDSHGVAEAMIANADGSGVVPLTLFEGGVSALAIRFGG